MKINSTNFFKIARSIMASYLTETYHVQTCPYCHSQDIVLIDQDGDYQRYLCDRCGDQFGTVKNDYNDYDDKYYPNQSGFDYIQFEDYNDIEDPKARKFFEQDIDDIK